MDCTQQQAYVPEHGIMCGCVPHRLAIFANGALCVVIGIILIFLPHFFETHWQRVFMGGYSFRARCIMGVIQVAGTLFGILCVIGALTLNAKYIRLFNYYMKMRLVAFALMYYTDIPLMWNCEMWISDINGAIAKYGWNEVMYTVATNGNCYTERWQFVICSGISLMFFVYLVIHYDLFLSEVDSEPKYLLRVPKGHPNGAFYTVSEASQRIQRKHQGMMSGAPPFMGAMGQYGIVGQPVGMAPSMGAMGPGMMPPMGPGMMPPMGPGMMPPMGPGMMPPMGPGMMPPMGPGMMPPMGPGMMSPMGPGMGTMMPGGMGPPGMMMGPMGSTML